MELTWAAMNLPGEFSQAARGPGLKGFCQRSPVSSGNGPAWLPCNISHCRKKPVGGWPANDVRCQQPGPRPLGALRGAFSRPLQHVP